MIELYPIKFLPITQYRIWGGNILNQYVSDEFKMENLGEIWSISGVENNVSIVQNGALKGKNLNELIQIYQEKLVGNKVWEKFGEEFPLLIKFINAAQPLSVQVHPDDEQAKKLHNSFGKTEMWYITQADKNAELIIGFKEGVDKNDYLNHLENETLDEILRKVPVKKGDAFYIPSGRVHAICGGITLAEIQQTSDVTYRIYDYNRIDKDGKKRQLHTDLALDAIDFNFVDHPKAQFELTPNKFNSLINSSYFKTKIFKGSESITFNSNDEMRIYICTEGTSKIKTASQEFILQAYESILIPAQLEQFEISPNNHSVLIEVTID